MDILDDMGVSKLSAKVFFKSELLRVNVWIIDAVIETVLAYVWQQFFLLLHCQIK